MIRSLEGLRGLAALLVALYHLKLFAAYLPAIRHGWIFVDLFFVLSGFVIAGAYSERLSTPRQAAAFMLRRFGRLFPLLVFSTLLWVLVSNGVTWAKIEMVARGMGGALRNPDQLAYTWPSGSEILSTLTMTHSLGVHDHLILNFVSWSISVEFWAYALFALLVLTIPTRWRTPVFLLLAACAYAVTMIASVGGEHQCLSKGQCLAVTYDFGFTRCIASFFLGAVIWQHRNIARRLEDAAQVGSAILIVALLPMLDIAPAVAFVFPLVFGALIWSFARDTGPLAKLLAGPAGAALGLRSYSIYMLHPILIIGFYQLVQRFQGPLAGIAIVVAYIGALWLASGWVYRRIEAPARDYFNRVAAGIERGTATAAA